MLISNVKAWAAKGLVSNSVTKREIDEKVQVATTPPLASIRSGLPRPGPQIMRVLGQGHDWADSTRWREKMGP